MSDEWGDWRSYDGSGMPVNGDVLTDIWTKREDYDGHTFDPRPAAQWDWTIDGSAGDIIRYRIRKPRGLTMLEDIANGDREPVDA